MGLVVGHWSVLYALGHDEYFAWTDPNGAIPQLNCDVPKENQKEVVGIVVLVPDEFTLDLHNHEVMPIEATDNPRLPVVRKCCELIDKIYRVSDFHLLPLTSDTSPQ
jgi:hypothetical protein